MLPPGADRFPRMNVFLSHSTRDKDFVTVLAAALTAASIEPWLCEVDVPSNANFVTSIESGLRQADVSLLVWSPDAAKSMWTAEEWTSVLARQVAEQRIRLGIVLYRDCPLPELLRTKNYIDARADADAGVRDTVAWLQKRASLQRLSGLQAPVYLPDYRPKDFVGRTTYLARLREMLTAEPATVLLSGEPGAGKSLLALQFAWDAQKDFDAVVYQSCGQREVDAITGELCNRLPIDGQSLSIDERRRRALDWLRGRQSLLVLDDVWNNDVRQLEPGPPCSVLYTSRQATLPWVPASQSVQLLSFSEAEALELFHTGLALTFSEEELTRSSAALLDFARKVDLLPLAVAVAAGLLRAKAASRLDRSIPRLHLADLSDGVRDVPQLFAKAISSRPEREQRLLAASAVCVADWFWLPLAARIAGLDEDEVDDAAASLVNASLMRLINRDHRRFQVHAILREEVLASRSQTQVEDLQRRHVVALEALAGDWKSQSPLQFHQEVKLACKFLEAYGKGDASLGLLRHAEAMWGEFGHLSFLLLNYEDQAYLLQKLGRPDEAISMLERQEAVCRNIADREGLRRGHVARATILNSIGRSTEALALLDEEHASIGDPDDKQLLLLGWHLRAFILQNLPGREQDSIRIFEKVEPLAIELGDKNSLAFCYWTWGTIAANLGQLNVAHDKLPRAVALFTELGNAEASDTIQRFLDGLGR